MSIETVKQSLEGTLDSSVFSVNSLYGIAFIVIMALLVVRRAKRVTSSVGSVVGFVLFIEIGHIVAFNSPIGEFAPITQTLFKFDVFGALAQLCVGTPLADALLYVEAWMTTVMVTIAERILDVIAAMGRNTAA